MQPKVTVIIITYNQEDYIGEAIESALSQRYQNKEIVVCDDFSTDATADIIRAYANKYPSLVIPQIGDSNIGITGNCNRGFSAATGDFICFLGGDDYFLDGKIEAQVNYMLDSPEKALSYHDVYLFDDNSNKDVGLYSDRHGKKDGGIKELLVEGCFFCATSVMIRKEFAPVNGFDPRIARASDWLFWCQTVINSQEPESAVGYCDGVFAKYRRHSGNITNVVDAKALEEALLSLTIIEETDSALRNLVRYCKSKRLLTYSAKYLLNKKWRQAFSAMKEALNLSSFRIFGVFSYIAISYGRAQLTKRFRNLK